MATDVRYLISLQDKFSSKINTINKSTQSFDQSLGRTIGRFASFAVVGAVLTSSVKKIADFEEKVSNLSAITGAVGKDLDYLKAKAIEMGGATTKSSIDTVEAFKLIASAKPELLTNKAALAATTKEAIALSEASGLELPQAAEALTDALNQFNLSADQSSRVINILAAGSKYASAEIPDLTASLKQFGGVADSMNISIEQSSAVVETLSAKGIKGSVAGVNLRNIFLKLASTTDKKLNPKIVGLSQALKNLAPIQDDVTKLTKMFDARNVIAIQTLIKQRQRVDELTDSMTGTSIAYEQQKVNTDNLNSDIKRLSSSWEKLVLNIDKGEGSISNAFRNATQWATRFLDKLDDINKSDKQRVSGVASKEMEAFQATLLNITTEEELQSKILEEQKKTAFFISKHKSIVQEAGKKELQQAKDLMNIGHTVSRALMPKKTQKAAELIASETRLKGLQEYQAQLSAMSREGLIIPAAIVDDQDIKTQGLDKVEDQVTRITSSAPKVFNINIDKFVENFTVASETVTEGAAQVKDVFTEMWIKMLADAQAVGG